MTGRQARIVWSFALVVLGAIALGLSVGHAQAKKDAKAVSVESLLPAQSVLYVGFDGSARHKESWEKTAAYDALYSSGLMDAIEKMVRGVAEKSTTSPEAREQSKSLETLVRGICEQGGSLAVSIPAEGAPLPQVTLVIHDAAPHEPFVRGLIEKATQNEKLKFEAKEVEGRTVYVAVIPGSPGVEIGWFTEGNHLVAVAGIGAVESSIGVVTGKSENITTNPNWATYKTAKVDYDVTTVSWLDFNALRKIYGDKPLPRSPDPENPIKVSQVVEALGLDTLGTIVCRQGYKEKSLWNETFVEAPGPRKGLLALIDQKAITLQDLPPIPWGTNGFAANSVDWPKFYDEILATVQKVAKLGPEDASAQVDGTIEQIPAIVGFDPRAELLETLGNTTCVYTDSRNNFLGMDLSIVVEVKDAETLRKTINGLLARLSEQGDPKDVTVRRTTKHKREIVTFEIKGGAFNPSLVIDDKWLCIGLYPQSVEAFVLRLDGRLSKWEPSESYVDAFKAMPKEFTSVTANDPRKTYRALVGLAPVVMPMVQQGLQKSGFAGPDGTLPVSLADLPPAELVARPLFPNLSMCTVEEEGIRWTSRSSLPSVPFFGGSPGGSIGAGAVGAALLLPAIQQAREAARRTTSKNNLRQLGLAMHNFHDAQTHFPAGTIAPKDKEIAPEKRLSWVVSLLPYLDQGALYNQFDRESGYESEANSNWSKVAVPALRNPGVVEKARASYSTMHYVGIAGVGKDAATLPVTDKKAGIFGTDRVTRIRDITDGTSNTMMITEASKDFPAWAGGSTTLRSLTTKPYINGPDGIGGPFKGGCHILMADGSVRFVSAEIDPATFEALSTINGGEVIPGF